MSYRNPARLYRESAIRGASPLELTTTLFGMVVNDLRAAARATRAAQIEARTFELNHALSALEQLQGTLNPDGGEVASNLDRFYHCARAVILDATLKNAPEAMEKLAEEFSAVRQAFQQIATQAQPVNVAPAVTVGA